MFFDEFTPIEKLIWLFWASKAGGGSGVETTVSGVSPLSLLNAVAHSVVSLTQTGKCATSGGDIYCNNGKLVAVDDELPSGYKRLESISFDGAGYYNTGEKLHGFDVVTMTISGTSTTGQNLFGCYSGTSAINFSLYIYGAGSSSNSYFRYGDTLLRPRYGSGKKTISFGVGGTSGFADDASVGEKVFETDSVAWIGMLPNSTSPAFTGDIWGSVVVGERLEWIPCERQADGVVCYYEKYSETILEPIGGTPSAGKYDTTHENTLAVVGTPEVLTLTDASSNTQTASVVNLLSFNEDADTQEIIGGVVTRKVGVSVSDGVVTLYSLAEPATESVAAQHLVTSVGTNTVTVTAEVSDIPLTVVYKGTE